MHLLARIIPEREDANELRTIVCLQCNDGVLTMQGLTNEDARRVVADHFWLTETYLHTTQRHSGVCWELCRGAAPARWAFRVSRPDLSRTRELTCAG